MSNNHMRYKRKYKAALQRITELEYDLANQEDDIADIEKDRDAIQEELDAMEKEKVEVEALAKKTFMDNSNLTGLAAEKAWLQYLVEEC